VLTVEGFVDELEALRAHMGFSRMHLLGHSFGGLIAGEYTLRYPQHVATVQFASASIDIPRWIADGQRLIGELPLMQKMILREALRTGQYNSPQFSAALAAYYTKHVYGFTEKPESIIRAEAESDARTYQIVWGANELAVTGYIKDYNLCPRLPEIQHPALCISGRFDEATPEAHHHFAGLLPNGRCHIFEHSAHHPHITETDQFLEVERGFLAEFNQ
jgi:proline iminopeptidase